MPEFEKIGVEAVVGSMPVFEKTLAAVDSLVKRVATNIQASAAKTKDFDKSSSSASKSSELLAKAMQKIGDIAGQIGGPIGNMISQLLSMVGVGGAAAAAIAAVAAAIFALGMRGGTFKGVEDSFNRLTASIGVTADVMLSKLSAAARGTISDFELMKQANIALAGATGQFATEFATKLPSILEIARVQARATGQSINYLFESLVLGIKRGSPLLIDNTGLVLKVEEANKQYAASIGKTVEAMTAQEKQIALLNAVVAAGDVAIKTLGSGQELATEKFARFNATISNVLDTLGVLFEPLVASVLDVINVFAGAFQGIVETISGIFSPIIEVISAVIGAIASVLAPIVGIITDIISEIGSIVGSVVETIAAPFQVAVSAIGNIFGGLINAIRPVLQGILNIIGQAAGLIIGLARGFFMGGARIIGALAGGIVQAANTLVFPAIKSIAKGIADFLVGLSPPPEGPLSRIDKGGANVMSAWLDGFLGVSLDPIEQVAGQVSAAMGRIANFSLDQVNARLKQLDKAIAPFANRVTILRAEFDALKGPVDAAFNAIDRQMEKAVQALANGDANAAALVRQLDAQRDSLQNYVDAQQESIDNAELQLALAKAQQAQERALLSIQKKKLEDELRDQPKPQGAGAGSGNGGTGKEKKGGGGGGTTEPSGGGGAGGGLTAPAEGGGFADQLQGELDAGFAAGVGGEAGIAALQENVAGIQTELGRIGSVDLGSKLKEKFASIFDPNKEGSVLYQVKEWFKQTFDPANPESVPAKLASLGDTIGTSLAGLADSIQTNVIEPMRTTLEAGIDGIVLWLTSNTAGSLPYEFLQLVTVHIPNALKDLGQSINDALVKPIIDKIGEIYANVYDFFGSGNEGSVSWILDKAVEFFAALPQRIGDALKAIGQFVLDAFVKPIVNAINTVIQAFQDFINDIIIPGLKGIPLLNIQIEPVSFGKLSMPGAARGGMFGDGLLKVGERGTEYLASGSSKMGIFPNRFVRSLDRLASVMTAQPAPVMVPGGNNTNNYYDNSGGNITANFNGSDRRHEMMRMLGTFRASRR